jgi:UDP-glucose 4-epimerase
MIPIRSALVIGGSGFIGSALLRRLVSEVTEVRTLVFKNRAPKPPSAGEALTANSSSISDLSAALAGSRFDAVFHLAASGVSPENRSVETLIDGNSGLLSRVLQSLSLAPPGIFIYTGSCAEYSEAPSGRLLDEEWPTMPRSLYGASKASATILGSALAQRLGIRFVALRLFHIFGPGEGPSRFVPYVVRTLARGETARLTHGNQIRDFMYVEDVVDAIVQAALHGVSSSVYNVCSGKPTAVRDVALLLASISNTPSHLLDFGAVKYNLEDPMWLAGNNRRLAKAIGWAPKYSLEAGLRQTVSSLLEEGSHGRV